MIYGYVRVSTAEQASTGDSLATQRQQITGFCMMQGWHGVDEFFVDAGVSGSIPLSARAEGQRMLQMAKPTDRIVVAKLDRAFRSAADALANLEFLKQQSISLYMLDLGGDVCGNGISKLVFTILSAVAENERDRLRERIREVKRHLAAQGVYGGGKRPFGYTLRNGRLIPNSREQARIAEIRQLRGNGAKLRAIATQVGLSAMTVKRILDRKPPATPKSPQRFTADPQEARVP
jgi:DNA invertase Pin-like site-specific DNA recombinase